MKIYFFLKTTGLRDLYQIFKKFCIIKIYSYRKFAY